MKKIILFVIASFLFTNAAHAECTAEYKEDGFHGNITMIINNASGLGMAQAARVVLRAEDEDLSTWSLVWQGNAMHEITNEDRDCVAWYDKASSGVYINKVRFPSWGQDLAINLKVVWSQVGRRFVVVLAE